MELATIFLIWLAITAIDNLTKRKKRRLPPPQNNPSDFDIPTLANDPNLPSEELPIFIESPKQVEVRPKDFTPPQPPKKSESRREASDTPDDFNLSLTPSTVMNAFIISELIDKPKALRKKNFRR